jgi:integral membrane sensor domain MASE1
MTVGVVVVLALAVRAPFLGAVAGVVTDALSEVGFRSFETWFLNRKIGRLVLCTPSSPYIFLAYDADKLLRSHEFLRICLHDISPSSNVVFSEGVPGLG